MVKVFKMTSGQAWAHELAASEGVKLTPEEFRELSGNIDAAIERVDRDQARLAADIDEAIKEANAEKDEKREA